MKAYVIRDVDGEIVNTVFADQAYIDVHFPGAAAFNLSEEQLDTLFIAAKELQL